MSDAYSSIADMIVPSIFTANMTEAIKTRSKLWRAGILVNDPKLDLMAVQGGVEVTVPFWKNITFGEAETLAEGTALTVNKVTMGSQKAYVLARGKAFGETDLAIALNNNREDPIGAIQMQLADYWANEQQTALLYMLDGVFGTALATSHSVDADGSGDVDASTGANLDPTIASAAKAKLGDNIEAFENGAIVMHSDVYYNLEKLGYITRVPVAVGQALADAAQAADVVGTYDQYDFSRTGLSLPMVTMFAGMRVIVDSSNGVTKAAAGSGGGYVYKTYMFKPGSIAYGNALAPVPFETFRDELKGQGGIITRQHYVLHPYGMSFTASGGSALSGSTPTNAELATAAKWSKVFTDNRNIEFVRIRSNG